MAKVPSTNNQSLTLLQQSFVDNYLANGGNGKQACITAGYSENSAHVQASKLTKLPHIQQALLKGTAEAIGLGSAKAVQKLVSLSGGAKSEYVQLEASRDLLDRAGLKAPDRSDIRLDSEIKISIDLT